MGCMQSMPEEPSPVAINPNSAISKSKNSLSITKENYHSKNNTSAQVKCAKSMTTTAHHAKVASSSHVSLSSSTNHSNPPALVEMCLTNQMDLCLSQGQSAKIPVEVIKTHWSSPLETAKSDPTRKIEHWHHSGPPTKRSVPATYTFTTAGHPLPSRTRKLITSNSDSSNPTLVIRRPPPVCIEDDTESRSDASSAAALHEATDLRIFKHQLAMYHSHKRGISPTSLSPSSPVSVHQ